MGQIILASASPRRKELLEQIGISFEICPAKGEERITKSVPHEVVEELASQKAIEVASMVRTYEETHQELVTPSDLMVIGADTIVSCGGQILGKPKDEHDACRMLKLLSGGTHQVYTGVSIVLLDASGKAGQVTFHEKTDVTMRAMSEEELKEAGVEKLPMNLMEACQEFEKDEYIKNVLGNDLVQKYTQAKKKEYEEYVTQVTEWELNKYLHRI